MGTYFDDYGLAISAFDADYNYIDLVLDIVDKCASLKTRSGFCTYDNYDGYWYDYFETYPIEFK